tara:strand:- start:42 stop:599 length:558 start_codon:yes stop_codon:yes gene_type:complete
MSNYKPLIKPINNFIKTKCWDYLKTHNLGNRGVYDGNKEKQFVGLLAEMETYNLLKGYYPDLDEKEDGFDGGIDIVLYDRTIDVKAMGRKYATRANYVNNFTKLQIHYNCDILLFTSVNKVKNLIEFCGYIWKSEIDTLGTLHKKGSIRKRGRNDNFKLDVDNYEVKNSDLRNIRDIIDWSYFGF